MQPLTSSFARAKETAERVLDQVQVDKGLEDFTASIRVKAANPGAEPAEANGWTVGLSCTRLCPRDFSKQFFDNLQGFQALVNECFNMDAAFRISVSHTQRPEEERNPFEDDQKEQATVTVQVDLKKPFRDGAIIIDGDEFICTMSQVICARDYASIPIYKPLKLKLTAQAV